MVMSQMQTIRPTSDLEHTISGMMALDNDHHRKKVVHSGIVARIESQTKTMLERITAGISAGMQKMELFQSAG